MNNEEVPCSTHPDAPHGFDRGSSHSSGRYVCDCEGWEPDEAAVYVVEALRWGDRGTKSCNGKEKYLMTTKADRRIRDKTINRFEVIDETGRVIVKYDVSVELNYQDDGKTLKVFLKDKKLRGHHES